MPEFVSLDRETQYLVFREVQTKGKTRAWDVMSRRHGFVLGHISWWGAWRDFIFAPAHDTVFNKTCMEELAGFCRDARADWHESKQKERQP